MTPPNYSLSELRNQRGKKNYTTYNYMIITYNPQFQYKLTHLK